jgi:hypothetical protein
LVTIGISFAILTFPCVRQLTRPLPAMLHAKAGVDEVLDQLRGPQAHVVARPPRTASLTCARCAALSHVGRPGMVAHPIGAVRPHGAHEPRPVWFPRRDRATAPPRDTFYHPSAARWCGTVHAIVHQGYGERPSTPAHVSQKCWSSSTSSALPSPMSSPLHQGGTEKPELCCWIPGGGG